MRVRCGIVVAMLTGLFCTACARSPGRPAANSEVIPPTDVLDFKVLYAANCAGCHGPDGQGGAALALGDPVFLAIANDEVIRTVASNGVEGTPMPAFARSAGGMLAEKQVDAIVAGIRSWAKPEALSGVTLPSYTARNPGDPDHGAKVYVSYCSSCHGSEGRGGVKAGSIVDGSFLALVSDQDLRTIVITGRPDLGAPDWRGNGTQPMSDQDISDVVAWLSSQRRQFPGQPYPGPYIGSAKGVGR
jgi:cytochrome c oxidase cbb3-type subunit III